MLLPLQSEANDKFNELEEQLQQIKDQIKVCTVTALHAATAQGDTRTRDIFAACLLWLAPRRLLMLVSVVDDVSVPQFFSAAAYSLRRGCDKQCVTINIALACPVLCCNICCVHQADQADLRAFEAATASARSQGLFFKNLYQPDLEEEQQEVGSSGAAGSSGSSRSRAPLDPAAARKAAAVVTSSAEEEVSSPFRMYLFGAMAAVLALVVGQGETSGVYGRRGCLQACMHEAGGGDLSSVYVGLLVNGCSS